MKIVFYPEITDLNVLKDLFLRACWHFGFDDRKKVYFLINELLKEPTFEELHNFDDSYGSDVLDNFEKFSFFYIRGNHESHINDADVILKWVEGDVSIDNYLKSKNKKIYRVDKNRVRQEGSFYIQCSFDYSNRTQENIEESMKKLGRLYERAGSYEESWVIATGPSVENYSDFDYEGKFSIVCNSVILNDDLMARVKPQLLVFADPIFHFGVSAYAGAFRSKVEDVLNHTDLYIIVPIKYYEILISRFNKFKDRIIGVPFFQSKDFNFNLISDFKVKVTANILTLLLLPVATTFSKIINIIGCDGRPIDEDDYFWRHGGTVQLNDKMSNIKEVHPGFFDIDYNEYYFEHCHLLEQLFVQGESLGKIFCNRGFSYIPPLAERMASDQFSEVTNDRSVADIKNFNVIIEPDGIGVKGHYVEWHNSLLKEIKSDDVVVFVNKRQDCSVYNAKAINVFSSHSWAVSRSDYCFEDDYESNESFKRFFAELEAAILQLARSSGKNEFNLFFYYGSTQILSGLIDLDKKLASLGVNLKVSICLFHESVFNKPGITKPRFSKNAKLSLLHSQVHKNYKVVTVTSELADEIYSRFGIYLKSMPNPVPSFPVGFKFREWTGLSENSIIHFPCSHTSEKGLAITSEFIRYNESLDKPYKLTCRKSEHIDHRLFKNTNFIECEDADTYWEAILSSDLIVIPYLSPNFKYRTSGIIVDAMVAKKPVLVLDDSWLARIVFENRMGLSIKYYSPVTIDTAISTISRKSDFFSVWVNKSYERYVKFNSWEELVDLCFFRD